MLSGFTNQVSSWMVSLQPENHEEKVPTEDTSPLKTSRLDMLSNIKTHIGIVGGWLRPCIPKVHKGNAENGTPSAESVKSSSEQKNDNDNSGPIGESNSGPQSSAETSTQEKQGQFENVQNKAVATAKSFGSLLYTVVNKAAKTISEAGEKIKKTVEENSILGQFNKEQESFLKSQTCNSATALPPWVGCPNEAELKEEYLNISTDRLNFMRSPPAGADFQFDYETSYPVAMAILEEDPNLERMRYELVPKVINEVNFWRNYFYRVSLICRAHELSFMSSEGDSQFAISDSKVKDFVLDCMDASKVEEDIKILSIESKQQEGQWDKELEAELQDYEENVELKTNW